MEKLILADCDGCLLDWITGFNKFMALKGFFPVEEAESFYNLGKRFNMPQLTAMEYAIEFNKSEYLGKLEPYHDAKKYVKLLADEGFKFIIISSMSDNRNAIVERMRNLREVFGDCIFDVHGLDPSESKQHVLLKWADTGYFWIEDHFKNAEAGYEVGLKPILVSNEYNSKFRTDVFPHTSIETPWEDIYNIVMQRYGTI